MRRGKRLAAGLLLACIAVTVTGCAPSGSPAESTSRYRHVESTFTTERAPQSDEWFTVQGGLSIPRALESQEPLPLLAGQGTDGEVITVDLSARCQTIEGFGCSFEGTTVSNLLRLPEEERRAVVKALVDPEEGAGMNLWRICFGSSDFVDTEKFGFYSYSEEEDFTLSNFSIQKDIDYGIIDILKLAQEYNPEIRFFASPWSPPGWMKTSGSMIGGTLRRDCYEVAARYYAKAVEAYQALGIPITAFTLQNECGVTPEKYPGCLFSPADQAAFVQEVRRAFDSAGLTTRIFCLDHNFDMTLSWVYGFWSDPAAYAACDGTAYHNYNGSSAYAQAMHEAAPDKAIWMTEHSEWGVEGVNNIIGYLRNWCSTYNAWVTMIDTQNGPQCGAFYCNPTLVIKDAASDSGYWYTPEYYLLAQFSKFIPAGAVRVESSPGSTDTVTNVAFENPDGSVVLVVANATGRQQTFTVNLPQDGTHFTAALPAATVGTFVVRPA